MSEAPTHRAFFGDGEKTFALPVDLIIELERKAGCGIGALARRFFNAEFHFSDLTEVARLGLVGGGTDPEDAAALVNLYAPRMSVTALYELTAPLIELVMFGAPKPQTEASADA